MNVFELNKENFDEEVLKSEGKVLIDFYADWCGPCKMMSPIIDKIAEELEDIKVGKVNVDDNQNLAVKYRIMSIPTIIIFKEGNEYKRFVGLRDKQELIEALKNE